MATTTVRANDRATSGDGFVRVASMRDLETRGQRVVKVGERQVLLPGLVDEHVLRRIAGCVVSHDEDVLGAEPDLAGYVELERREVSQVVAQVLAIEPDIGLVVYGPEAQREMASCHVV